MNPDNRKLLDQWRHYHTTLVKAFYMMGLDGHTRSGMVRIICEEFQPGYATDLWCPPCVSDMVLLLYRYYDAWLITNTDPVPEPESVEMEDDEPELFTDPADDFADQPMIVKASFPKNHHRK